jgi:hypothetical protein
MCIITLFPRKEIGKALYCPVLVPGIGCQRGPARYTTVAGPLVSENSSLSAMDGAPFPVK